MEPANLSDLLSDSRVHQAQSAIVATFKTLLPQCAVSLHPGKLALEDVLSKDIKRTPALDVGWHSMKAVSNTEGTHALRVTWIAYVVTEDHADKVAKRAIDKIELAQAIGWFLLTVLGDPDAPAWGLKDITMPGIDDVPEFKPLFTARAYTKGTVFYALTWSQTLIGQGQSFMAGDTPYLTETGALDVPDDGLPPEIIALMGKAEAGDG